MNADAGLLEVVELDELLDFEPCCQGFNHHIADVRVMSEGCERPAKWVGTAVCCGLVRLYCEEHRTVRERLAATCRHAPCGARPAPVAWAPLGRP